MKATESFTVTVNDFCQFWLKTTVRLCFLMHRKPPAKPCIKEGNIVVAFSVHGATSGVRIILWLPTCG